MTVGQLLLGGLVLFGLGGAWMWPRPAPEVGAMPERDAQKRAVAAALATVTEAWASRECVEGACDEVDPAFARRVATEARYQLTHPDLRFRDDCSGFVSAVFTEVGVEMDGVVSSIYDLAAVHGTIHWSTTPRVGDLVFFDDTHDRNGNGRWDDTLTHIGIIVDVEPDGTAVYAHAGTRRGRQLGRINVAHPMQRRDADGKEINTYLREPNGDEDPIAAYLSGALWVGWATVDPELDWRTAPPPPESWP